ncbi:helix-turn-helix domain-containing transcriptional regulator [Crocosphaera sp. Alani8]|uniref:helix-turn-helix domain-containing transcriptional regulator n=1 Tax=Crocosphaera sp. Alani8 TaxID=3038952 RepID=UPI00313BE12F
MALTRDYIETVNKRVKQDPELAKALLDEATSLFLNGEPETARLILRDLVNSTIGFEELANQTSKPSKSLHRMLSAKGNPTMDNLTAIYSVLCKELNVYIGVTINSSSEQEHQLSSV